MQRSWRNVRRNPEEKSHLIKVQPHNNVWLFRELVHGFQEVHVADVLTGERSRVIPQQRGCK